MSEWRLQLDSSEASLQREDRANAFIKAFGALEICLSAVAQNLGFDGERPGEDRFATILRLLGEKNVLRAEERLRARHIADARACVAHKFGFEPSKTEVQRTIRDVERLCAKFGKKVYDVMIKPVLTAKLDDPIALHIPSMMNDGISHIPVVRDDRVIGTLRDSDVLKAWEGGEGILDPNTRVEDLMSSWIIPSVRADISIEEARRVMLREETPAVVVLNAGLPQGILTRFDLLQHVELP